MEEGILKELMIPPQECQLVFGNELLPILFSMWHMVCWLEVASHRRNTFPPPIYKSPASKLQ